MLAVMVLLRHKARELKSCFLQWYSLISVGGGGAMAVEEHALVGTTMSL